jgi:hypothetical protein
VTTERDMLDDDLGERGDLLPDEFDLLDERLDPSKRVDARAVSTMSFPRWSVATAFPLQDPGGNHWVRTPKNGGYLLVASGIKGSKEDGTPDWMGVPFGDIPMMACWYISAEARRTGSPVIHLGDSLIGAMRRIGLVDEETKGTSGDSGNLTRFREQMRRLGAAQIFTIEYDDPAWQGAPESHFTKLTEYLVLGKALPSGLHVGALHVVKRQPAWVVRERNTKGELITLELSHEFFQLLTDSKRYVSVDPEVVRRLLRGNTKRKNAEKAAKGSKAANHQKGSVLALQLYLYLADAEYLQGASGEPYELSLLALYHRLGSTTTYKSKAYQSLRAALAEVIAAEPRLEGKIRAIKGYCRTEAWYQKQEDGSLKKRWAVKDEAAAKVEVRPWGPAVGKRRNEVLLERDQRRLDHKANAWMNGATPTKTPDADDLSIPF